MKTRISLTLLIAAAAALSFSQPAEPLAKLVGKKVPAFSMKDLKGRALSDQSLRGKVVLLDFWASWCGPCKMASPTMQALHKKYAAKGLVVIGANAMDEGSTTEAPKYAKEHGYTYSFTSRNDAFAQKLGVQGIPAFVFIDRKGVIRRVQTGWNMKESPKLFEATVKQLLAAR